MAEAKVSEIHLLLTGAPTLRPGCFTSGSKPVLEYLTTDLGQRSVRVPTEGERPAASVIPLSLN